MASRKPYECFRCRDNGYPNTMVYLTGKDEQGKTVYVEEDGKPHLHKVKQQEQEESKPQPKMSGNQTEQATTQALSDEKNAMATKIINAKLDRIIALLESQKQT